MSLINLETEERTAIKVPLDPQLDVGDLLWRPDGKMIAFQPQFLRGTHFKGKGLSMTVTPVAPKDEDLVWAIKVDDAPKAEPLMRFDRMFRLTHWQPEADTTQQG